MKAKTDSGPTEPDSPMPDYIQNIFQLMRLVSQQDTLEHFETAYRNCSIRYGDMKKQLAEDMVKFISPVRTGAKELLENEEYLKKVMKLGAEKAGASAGKTIKLVRQAMGLNYF
jgi:tryptophanyl-tRNA synthetase